MRLDHINCRKVRRGKIDQIEKSGGKRGQDEIFTHNRRQNSDRTQERAQSAANSVRKDRYDASKASFSVTPTWKKELD